MALIQCPECGNTISNKAKNCPKCGFSVVQNTLTSKSQRMANDYVNDYPKKQSSLKWLYVIMGVLIVGNGIIGYLIWNEYNIKTQEEEKLIADSLRIVEERQKAETMLQVKEQMVRDSLMAIEYERKRKMQEMVDAYIKRLSVVNEITNFPAYNYALFDITGDDIPELWVTYRCGDGCTIGQVYTYINGMKRIYEYGHWASVKVYRGKGYVLMDFFCDENRVKLTYNGKIREKKYYVGYEEDYPTPPSEREMDWISADNKDPIRWLAN